MSVIRAWELQHLTLGEYIGTSPHVPHKAKVAIENSLPLHKLRYRVGHRVAGIGSLGRQRLAALARLNGSWISREAKELTASATVWANEENSEQICYSDIVTRSIRAPDPYLQVYDNWVVRRLSPDYIRFELGELRTDDCDRLIRAMGWELANVHVGTPEETTSILDDLRCRDNIEGLAEASQAMLESLETDFDAWRDSMT
jgi:hypothetical protein